MQKTSKRVLALVLSLVMVLSVFSISATAYNADYQSETHTVFRHTEQTLAPGVEFYKNYAYASDGNQMVYFVTTADISRDDVVVQTSYKDQYKDGELGMARLMQQVAFANQYYSDPTSPQYISEYYNVVSGCNASFYNMTTGQPTGVCYIDGADIGTAAYPCFFAILKDGTAVVDDRGNKDSYTGDRAIWQAVGGSQWLVRNGEDVTASITGSYNTDRADRSSVGITADGKVVIMSLDGRQIPYSCGGSMHEIAQIMLEAGCVAAINLDGGGSTTFVAKEEGEDSVAIVNRPSDGSDRAISSGIIIASTAAPSNVFDHATLTPENNYMTVNATQKISAKGISPAGTSADIPADASFTTDNGTISADGTFSPASTGDATIQLVYNGVVVGETVVHVVTPTRLAFNITTLAVPYGKSSDIDIHMYYSDFNYEVLFVPADISFAISNPSFGQIEGLTFYATADTSVTGDATLTATSTLDANLTSTIPLVVGKGSEVIFDFEDQDVSGWSGGDMYNAGVVTTVSSVSADTGKVHSGDYAMAYNMDFSQLTYYEDYIASKMCYNADIIAQHGITTDADGVQQRGNTEDYVDITGAVGLGFWVYLPDEVAVAAFDPDFRIGGKKTASAAWAGLNGYMDEICDSDGLLITTDDINKEGWYYFHFDLSTYSSYYALRLQNCRLSNSTTKNGKTIEWNGDILTWYITDASWKKADVKSYNSNFTLYIDDFTVDYSSVVPDRDAPVFSNFTYAFAGASDAMALNNNVTISASNELEFAVKVAENTTKTNASGLDASSLKAYVDGNEAEASYKNGRITVPEVVFADGIHTVMFEASDNTGNTAHITRTFTVNNDSGLDTITIVPHDTTLTSTLVGSLYYIDVVATDISAVQSASVRFKLNNVNDWEPEGIVSAGGFTADYELESYDKGIIDLTITRTGDVAATGEAVLATIPVRVWYPHNALGKNSNWIITQKKCVYPMDLQVTTKAGSVSFTNGKDSTFSAAKIQIDSEAMCEHGYIGVNKGNEGGTNVVTSWHEHNAEPVEDKPATCIEDGYSGRTFCNECNSVIDWGMVLPATGHTYGYPDQKTYFIISNNGQNQSGDIAFDGGIGYWYDNGEYRSFNTDSTTSTVTFTQPGDWYTPYIYYWFVDADGNETVPVEWPGTAMTYAQNNDMDQAQYTFDIPAAPAEEKLMCIDCGELFSGVFTDGKLYEDGALYTGFFESIYYLDGVAQDYTGIVLIEAEGKYYEFDENHINQGVYTGLFFDDTDNVWRYLQLGELSSGWKQIDGDWYYFRGSTMAAATGHYHYDGPVWYDFEDNGKLIDGVWAEFDEGWCYFYGPAYYRASGVSNVKFVEIDGVLYGFDNHGYRYEGIHSVFESNQRTALLYDFDVVNGATLYTGLFEDRYYADGLVQNAYQLVNVNGDFYFISDGNKIAKNATLYLGDNYVTGKTFADGTPVAAGYYDFDEDGKMVVKNGLVGDYFYENGVVVPRYQLYSYDGSFYFINDGNKIVRSATLYLADKYVSGKTFPGTDTPVAPGNYEFGADGKMIVNDGPVGDYFYVNGIKQKRYQLVSYGNDYYFINDGDKLVKSATLYLADKFVAGTDFAPGYYEFDADGKMIVKNGPIDGYIYHNGTVVQRYRLYEYNGDYYFINDGNKYVKSATLYLAEKYLTDTGLQPGLYEFDADGKMIIA